jgi:hypothetical protein
MVDMAAIAAAASALKSAFDLSKTALSLRDATLLHGKITEMQGEISSALASAITAQTDQMAMLKRVSDLEKEITDLKAWETEKQRYELKAISYGAFAYVLKVETQGSEPPHQICAGCYQHSKKSILQRKARSSVAGSNLGIPATLICSECKSEIIAGS